MQYMKLSTSRDFRINAATLDAALQEQDDSQEVSAISDFDYTLCSVWLLLGEISVSVCSSFQPTESHDAEETQEPKQKKRKQWAEASLFDAHFSKSLTELDQLLYSLLAVVCLNFCSA